MTSRNTRNTPRPPAPADAHDRPAGPPAHGATRVGEAPEAPGSSPRDEGLDLPMPHERDEAAGHTAAEPDAVIGQAKRDLDAGLVDTDMRATPGLDAARRKDLVGTAGAPADSRKSDADVGRGPQNQDRTADRRRQVP